MKLLGLSLLAAAAAASPVVRRFDNSTVTVTSAEIASMALAAQWAGAAYCNNNATVGSAVTCSANVCPDVEAANATIVATMKTETLLSQLTDMQGYVAVDHVHNLLVVSYRGSSSLENWISDFEIALVPCALHLTDDLADAAGGASCFMHDGFGYAWESLKTVTMANVQAQLTANSKLSLVVTGHSLGAAVATLAAAELRHAGYTLDLYTFGSPRVGNEDLIEYITTQTPAGSNGINNYRATHLDDPVPRVPPRLFGYRHTSPEFWLGNGTTLADGMIAYGTSDITVCTGYASGDCNAKGPIQLDDFYQHRYYFEYITGC